MKAENIESASLWTKAPVANLVRYEPSGIYFARAKVRGKLVRKTLDTNILSVAKLRLADVLDAEHRAVAPSQTKIIGKMTFADALGIFRERQKHATDIKENTKNYNERAAIDLLKTWPGLEQTDVKRITKFDCLEWRSRFGKRYCGGVPAVSIPCPPRPSCRSCPRRPHGRAACWAFAQCATHPTFDDAAIGWCGWLPAKSDVAR